MYGTDEGKRHASPAFAAQRKTNTSFKSGFMHQAMQMVFNPVDASMRNNIPRLEHGTRHGSPRNAVN